MTAQNSSDETNVRTLRNAVRTLVHALCKLEESATPDDLPVSIPHAHALVLLLEQEEEQDESQMSISDLAGHLRIDRSNVSRLCGRMERAGELERLIDPEDARARRLSLTEEGRDVAERADSASMERFGSLAEKLSEEELEAVYHGAALLVRAIVDSQES